MSQRDSDMLAAWCDPEPKRWGLMSRAGQKTWVLGGRPETEIDKFFETLNEFQESQVFIGGFRPMPQRRPAFGSKLPVRIITSAELVKEFQVYYDDNEEVHNLLEPLKNKLNSLLELPDDWDGEGTSSYSQKHVARVETWLFSFFCSYYEHYDTYPPVPKVSKAAGPSIDVYWKKDKRSFLINFPEKEDEQCTFAGFDATEQEEFYGKSSAGKLISRLKCLISDFLG